MTRLPSSFLLAVRGSRAGPNCFRAIESAATRFGTGFHSFSLFTLVRQEVPSDSFRNSGAIAVCVFQSATVHRQTDLPDLAR
jgi:hypothetical protein